MLLRFSCPHCDTQIELDATRANADAPCPSCQESVTPPPPQVAPGVTLGNFLIERTLGHGAMGDVFLALQLSMDRRVALKVLAQALTRDARTIARFRREVRMSARLEHPNIVTAFEAGEDFGYHFLAMTYVEGENLGTRLKEEGAMEERDALRIGRQVAEALRYAWEEHQMLHRDIKPPNIMVEASGRARLMDLGISICLNEAHTTLTTAGMVVGTPHYMSPEQIRGEELDWRADAYSLGATLYHLVTGGTPFKGTGSVEVIGQHLNNPVVPAHERRGSLSIGLSLLLERMMAKNRDHRQRSWGDLLRDFDLVLAGKRPPLAPNPPPPPPSPAADPKKDVPARTKPVEPAPPSKERLPPVIDFQPRRSHPRRGRRLMWLSVIILAGILGLAIWKFWLRPRRQDNAPASANTPPPAGGPAELGEPAGLIRLLDKIADALLARDPSQAAKVLREAGESPTAGRRLRPAITRMEEALAHLRGQNKLLQTSFEADRGKKLLLHLRNGRKAVIINQVHPAALGVTFAASRGPSGRKRGRIEFRDISPQERLRRLDTRGTKHPSLHLYLGLLWADVGDYAKARQHFQASPATIRQAMLRGLDRFVAGKKGATKVRTAP